MRIQVESEVLGPFRLISGIRFLGTFHTRRKENEIIHDPDNTNVWASFFLEMADCIPKVVLLVFPVRYRTLNKNQSIECECVMEFLLSLRNVLILGLSECDM